MKKPAKPKMRKVGFYLTEIQGKRLDDLAKASQLSTSDVLRRMIDRFRDHAMQESDGPETDIQKMLRRL